MDGGPSDREPDGPPPPPGPAGIYQRPAAEEAATVWTLPNAVFLLLPWPHSLDMVHRARAML